jgi:hypothetical protein
LAVFVACVGAMLTVGCYSPNVPSGGFTCQPSDNPPCPTGFSCVNGLCVDHPGGGGTPDLVMSSMDDFSMPATGDMTMSRDLATGAADMTMPGTADMAGCFAFAHGCSSDPVCCAQCCAGGCTVFGYCALP